MEGEEGIRPGDVVPKVGGENVEKARGRQYDGGQFLLRLDVVFREVRITGDAVVDQIGNVPAVKALIVTEAGETGRGIDSEKNAQDGDEQKTEKDRAGQLSQACGVFVSCHCLLSRSCNALN